VILALSHAVLSVWLPAVHCTVSIMETDGTLSVSQRGTDGVADTVFCTVSRTETDATLSV
jgi:hypothetical protein